METLFAPLGELEEYDQLIRGIKQGEFPVQLIGCMDTQESHMIYGTGRDKRIRLVITHNEVRAKELVEDLKLYDHDVSIIRRRISSFTVRMCTDRRLSKNG